MNLKTRYFFYILVLHLLLSYLLYKLFEAEKYYFLASECIILLSLFISFHFYNSFIYPLKLIKSGKEAIQSEDFTIKYMPTGTSELNELIDTYNLMIDRLRMEKVKSFEQSYFLENLIRDSPFGIVILDYDKRIDLINRKAEHYFGQKAKQGMTLLEINSQLAKHINYLKHNVDQVFTIVSRKFRCRIQHIVHKGFLREFIIIEELTAEILTAEKEAYGKVIRMMAHEINNSMGAINSILETVKMYGFAGEKSDIDLENSLDIAIDRNKSLAKFTDNFAEIIRLPKPVKHTIDLKEIVFSIVRLFETQAKLRKITFDWILAEGQCFIQGDKIQLEQCISNILKNAMESIDCEGKIEIILTDNPINLTITDDGPGILLEEKDKLFTPFYSTKANGQGIGLMLTQEILRNHNVEFDLSTDQLTSKTNFKMKF